jgi:uncharacterized protein YuzE
MKLTYDPDVDALYIRFTEEACEVTTRQISDDVTINFAPDGRVVGIEVLDASENTFQGHALHTVILQNLTAITAP